MYITILEERMRIEDLKMYTKNRLTRGNILTNFEQIFHTVHQPLCAPK